MNSGIEGTDGPHWCQETENERKAIGPIVEVAELAKSKFCRVFVFLGRGDREPNNYYKTKP